MLVLIGSSLAGGIITIFLCGKAYYFSPLPWGSSSDRIDAVLQETKERLAKLSEEFETRQAEFERDECGDDPELLAELERRQAERASDVARNREIHAAADSVAQVPDQLKEQADAVQSAFKAAIGTATERVEDISKREG